ncbi:MAG TPA: response regulator [Chloroflexota bacterium]|nr:response regulator [Chloroflexota bacterium]
MLFGGRGNATQNPSHPPPPSVAPVRGAVILAVDDDATARAAIADTLGQAGYIVHAVSNYSDWDQVWHKGPAPSLLVLDIMLAEPRRGGYEILRALRREDSRTPVIMVSSRNTPADAAFARAHNANAFVSKVRGEFDHPERGLAATVARLLTS